MLDQLQSFASRFFDLTFYSTDLVFLACVVVLLGAWERDAKTALLRILEYALLLVFEAAVGFIMYALTGNASSMIVMVLTLMFYALLQRHLRRTDRIVRVCTFAAVLVLTIGITGIFAPAVTQLRDIPFGSVLPNILMSLTLLFVALYIRHFNVGSFRFIPARFIYLVVLVDILGALSGYAFMTFIVREGDAVESINQVNLIVNLSFLVLILITYGMFYMLAKEHETRTELLVRSRAEADNQEMIGVTRSVYESMREFRHEMRNKQAYVNLLVERGEYDQLKDYLNSFQSEAETLMHYVQTGNTSIDAVVNSKIALAKSKDIEVKTMLAVPPEIGIAEDDLYTLFANLLDNAIEGAEASGAENPSISLSVMPQGAYYIVTVSNPCKIGKAREGSFDQLRTTKDDREVHGFGSKIISKIAQRYNGDARFKRADGIFVATVMLIPENEQEAS